MFKLKFNNYNLKEDNGIIWNREFHIRANIHRLGLGEASTESINFVPIIEFHNPRQFKYIM